MKPFNYPNLAALGAMLLALVTSPGSLPGQTQAQPAAPPSASAQAPSDGKCDNLDSGVEQITKALRNIQLEGKLAGLADRLAKQEAVMMSSPELAKLQNLSGQLEGKEGQLEANAAELAARAQELTSELQDKLPTNLFVSPDEGSGWLGVEIDEVTPEKAHDLKLPATRGAIVSEVEPNSPAAKAGLKVGDVILQYDGQTVEGTVQFRRLIRETPPGRSVQLQISRDGRTQTLSVEISDRNAFYEKRMEGRMRDLEKPFAFATPNLNLNLAGPEAWFMDTRTPILGINAEDLNGQLGGYFGAPDNSGVLVREVRSGTPAEKAGLKAGDVIVKVDGKPVKTLTQLRDELRDKSDQKTVNLGVLRKGSELNVSVEIERPKPLERVQSIHRAQL